MRRLLKRSLLIFSSILFIGNAALWICSEYYLLDHLGPQENPSMSPLKVRWTYWSILEGKYEYARCFQDDTPISATENRPRSRLLSDHTKHYIEIPGIDFHRQTLTCVGRINGAFRIEFQCWLVALFTGIFPIIKIAQLFKGLAMRRRKQSAGLCQVCRYDTRAHAPGQKCPECGTLIETSPPPRL
jgi:hypothetical protein